MNASGYMRGWLMLVAMIVGMPSMALGETCLSCHRERDGALTASWEKSRHAAAGIDCSACHGMEHDGRMAGRARRNEACTTGCHQRESGSHALSKHGVIATLEGERMDFSLPLKEGNQRAPTCGYCHMHDNEHDAGTGILSLLPIRGAHGQENDPRAEARAAPCRDCHSPRFVETWFASGEQMLEIGRMKLREAEAVVSRHDGLPDAAGILQRMQEVHLRNVRLGVGHASPDDQWWHGHPALDGDLLRIKSLAGERMLQQSPADNGQPPRRPGDGQATK
ncbi:MAG: hypothetical protein HQM03_11240 [Magnetococcales bacterium]|nr:hypothetical protein [Magnetococcales bacterium]